MQTYLIEKLTANSAVQLTRPRNLLHRVPGHVSIVVGGALGEELVDEADSKGICISSASACSGRNLRAYSNIWDFLTKNALARPAFLLALSTHTKNANTQPNY